MADGVGLLNNDDINGHISYLRGNMSEASGLFKKSVQEGQSHCCARSVLVLREHGTMARTPLAAFFNRPGVVPEWG